MKKSTAYGRKQARLPVHLRHRHHAAHPVTEAVVLSNIATDIERLRNGVDMQAFAGADAVKLANLAGRLTFITAYAAGLHGLGEGPEARILAGTANALADLAEQPDTLERQRDTIIAGLAAIDRLMPQLKTISLAAGALELNQLLEATGAMNTTDVRRALLQKGMT